MENLSRFSRKKENLQVGKFSCHVEDDVKFDI